MSSTTDSVESGNSPLVLNDSENTFSKKSGLYIIGLTTVTAVSAGIWTAHSANKRGEKFLKDFSKPPPAAVLENPYILAFKALGWGTVWAVGGVSLLTLGVCSWLGIRNLEDLRTKIRQSRRPMDSTTNFETFQDLLNYLDKESKVPKSSPGNKS